VSTVDNNNANPVWSTWFVIHLVFPPNLWGTLYRHWNGGTRHQGIEGALPGWSQWGRIAPPLEPLISSAFHLLLPTSRQGSAAQSNWGLLSCTPHYVPYGLLREARIRARQQHVGGWRDSAGLSTQSQHLGQRLVCLPRGTLDEHSQDFPCLFFCCYKGWLIPLLMNTFFFIFKAILVCFNNTGQFCQPGSSLSLLTYYLLILKKKYKRNRWLLYNLEIIQ
jgi:hypothetical protein